MKNSIYKKLRQSDPSIIAHLRTSSPSCEHSQTAVSLRAASEFLILHGNPSCRSSTAILTHYPFKPCSPDTSCTHRPGVRNVDITRAPVSAREIKLLVISLWNRSRLVRLDEGLPTLLSHGTGAHRCCNSTYNVALTRLTFLCRCCTVPCKCTVLKRCTGARERFLAMLFLASDRKAVLAFARKNRRWSG